MRGWLFKTGTCLLVDPGAPHYTRKTFGPRRYESLFCRSRGHSVPVVNSHEQPPGRRYRGTLAVEGLNREGDKIVTIDMTRAYPDKTLKKLERRFVLGRRGGIELTDTYAFSRKPRSVEEAFVTF